MADFEKDDVLTPEFLQLINDVTHDGEICTRCGFQYTGSSDRSIPEATLNALCKFRGSPRREEKVVPFSICLLSTNCFKFLFYTQALKLPELWSF